MFNVCWTQSVDTLSCLSSSSVGKSRRNKPTYIINTITPPHLSRAASISRVKYDIPNPTYKANIGAKTSEWRVGEKAVFPRIYSISHVKPMESVRNRKSFKFWCDERITLWRPTIHNANKRIPKDPVINVPSGNGLKTDSITTGIFNIILTNSSTSSFTLYKASMLNAYSLLPPRLR